MASKTGQSGRSCDNEQRTTTTRYDNVRNCTAQPAYGAPCAGRGSGSNYDNSCDGGYSHARTSDGGNGAS